MNDRSRVVLDHDWRSIPLHTLEDERLGMAARVILAWQLAHGNGWEAKIGAMRRQLGITEPRWQRARDELVEAGYLTISCSQGDDGRIEWEFVFSSTPRAAIPTKRGYPRNPGMEKPGLEKGGATNTRSTTALKNTTTPLGGGDLLQIFLNAAGSPGVLGEQGLGRRLSKFLEGASQEQARWAGLAWADQVAKGKIGDPVALAITLSRAAAGGEVTRPAPVLQQEAAATTHEVMERQEWDRKEWAARQEEAIQKQVAAAGFSTSTKLRDRPYFRKSSHLTNT